MRVLPYNECKQIYKTQICKSSQYLKTDYISIHIYIHKAPCKIIETARPITFFLLFTEDYETRHEFSIADLVRGCHMLNRLGHRCMYIYE